MFIDLWGEQNLCALIFWSSFGLVLYTGGFLKECLGKRWICRMPLRRCKPLGGFWKTSPNFSSKYFKYLELSKDGEDKEGEYLVG